MRLVIERIGNIVEGENVASFSSFLAMFSKAVSFKFVKILIISLQN